MKNTLTDVFILESEKENDACYEIDMLYQKSLKGDRKARNKLKKCFESDWKTIKERFEVEGSDWYVWYMDGVKKFMNN